MKTKKKRRVALMSGMSFHITLKVKFWGSSYTMKASTESKGGGIYDDLYPK